MSPPLINGWLSRLPTAIVIRGQLGSLIFGLYLRLVSSFVGGHLPDLRSRMFRQHAGDVMEARDLLFCFKLDRLRVTTDLQEKSIHMVCFCGPESYGLFGVIKCLPPLPP